MAPSPPARRAKRPRHDDAPYTAGVITRARARTLSLEPPPPSDAGSRPAKRARTAAQRTSEATSDHNGAAPARVARAKKIPAPPRRSRPARRPASNASAASVASPARAAPEATPMPAAATPPRPVLREIPQTAMPRLGAASPVAMTPLRPATPAKAVTFSDQKPLEHLTFSPLDYDRRSIDYVKRRRSMGLIPRSHWVAMHRSVDQYKLLEMDSHPDSRGNLCIACPKAAAAAAGEMRPPGSSPSDDELHSAQAIQDMFEFENEDANTTIDSSQAPVATPTKTPACSATPGHTDAIHNTRPRIPNLLSSVLHAGIAFFGSAKEKLSAAAGSRTPLGAGSTTPATPPIQRDPKHNPFL